MFSKYEVYTDVGSLYCYKDSHVLRNKYGIQDYHKLKMLEQDIVGAKQQYLLSNPIKGRLTVNHLCEIHRFLFEDIYPFAGRFRRETIKKGKTAFLNEKEIPAKLYKLLDTLKREQYLTHLEFDQMIERLAFYLAELNYIHPFREGNGRSIREYIRLLIMKNGYRINWTAAGVHPMLDAMIMSIYDIEPLKEVLKISITKSK